MVRVRFFIMKMKYVCSSQCETHGFLSFLALSYIMLATAMLVMATAAIPPPGSGPQGVDPLARVLAALQVGQLAHDAACTLLSVITVRTAQRCSWPQPSPPHPATLHAPHIPQHTEHSPSPPNTTITITNTNTLVLPLPSSLARLVNAGVILSYCVLRLSWSH